MKKNHLLVVSALLAGLVAGCATNVGPGSKAADTPPRIVTNADKQNVWDNPGLFGPVPAELHAKGTTICTGAGFKKALGYHPQAKDLRGNTIAGGGYLCAN